MVRLSARQTLSHVSSSRPEWRGPPVLSVECEEWSVVPQGCAETYRSAEVWRNFKDIVKFDTNYITSIKTPVTQDTSIYDLTGRRFSSIPSHGVYIKNGRKYVR